MSRNFTKLITSFNFFVKAISELVYCFVFFIKAILKF